MKYAEYVAAEQAAGREPLPMPQWRAERMKQSQAAKTQDAELNVSGAAPIADEPAPPEPDPDDPALDEQPEPQPVAEAETPPEPPKNAIFWSENRERVEIMQAGGRTVVNGQIAVMPHRTIEFVNHHWTADLQNPDHREKAQWLMESEAVRKGEIVLVPQARPVQNRVQVQSGPRTSTSSRIVKVDPLAAMSARIE